MNRKLIYDSGEDCGIIGDVTKMTYKDGSFAQVGDVVTTNHDGTCFVVKDREGYFIMGLKSIGENFSNGVDTKEEGWTIELVKKCYDVEVGEEHSYLKVIEDKPSRIIIIDGKTIEISEESYQAFKEQFRD